MVLKGTVISWGEDGELISSNNDHVIIYNVKTNILLIKILSEQNELQPLQKPKVIEQPPPPQLNKPSTNRLKDLTDVRISQLEKHRADVSTHLKSTDLPVESVSYFQSPIEMLKTMPIRKTNEHPNNKIPSAPNSSAKKTTRVNVRDFAILRNMQRK